MTPIQARIMSAILNNAKVTLFSSQSMALDRFELTREQVQMAAAACEPLFNELTDKFAKRASRLMAAAETRREAAAKALKVSEYDCSDWDMDILREVADIAITAAAEAGEQAPCNDVEFGHWWQEAKRTVERDTIEMCAQIAINETLGDETCSDVGERIAAAIMARKVVKVVK